MNDACLVCMHARNCINGRWCDKLKSYVEYKEEIMCNEQKDINNISRSAQLLINQGYCRMILR